jgi:hypothetical protein
MENSTPLKYNKVHYEKFKNKNKDKINEKIECPICLGSYTYFNKSSHNKLKKHVKHLNKQQQTI